MKAVLILFVLTAFVSLEVHGATTTTKPPGSVSQGQTCSHQSDCQDGLCCVHDGFLGKKKRMFFDGLFQHDHGTCEPYKQRNEPCKPFMSHDIFNHELFEDYCPCEKTLECRGETVDEAEHSITHHNPKCQDPES